MNFIHKNKPIFLAIIVLVLLTGIVCFVLAFKTVEVTIQSKMQVDPKGTASFIIPNEEIYKIKNFDQICFKVNGDFFGAKIVKIVYDENKKMFMATLDRTNKFLIPGTWMDIDIFKESKTILSLLLSV